MKTSIRLALVGVILPSMMAVNLGHLDGTMKRAGGKKPAQTVIHEDDPRWDCRTMGNRTCGVTTEGVRYLVTHNAKGFPAHVARDQS